jgi:hypothetical protein
MECYRVRSAVVQGSLGEPEVGAGDIVKEGRQCNLHGALWAPSQPGNPLST